MKRCIVVMVLLFFGFCLTGLSYSYDETEITFFEWPIPVDSYNPYSFDSRGLGASSPNGRHTGEDIDLPEGDPFTSVGIGTLRRYNQDGSYPLGYGEFYAMTTHQLNRPLQVVVGDGGIETENSFLFIYGHIRNKENRSDEEALPWSIGATLDEDIDSENYTDVLGYINDNIHNGDGTEHLHLGVRPDHDVGKPYGYEKPVAPLSGYSPAHLVIAASRIGVFAADDTHAEPYWRDDGKSQPFIDKWWEEYPSVGSPVFKYMELDNYHNKLGRPHNNHPQAGSGQGTDFVHEWGFPKTEDGEQRNYRVFLQDMYQPYETDEAGNTLSRFGHGHTILMLNEWENKNEVHLLEGSFRDEYLTVQDGGPFVYGMVFTDKISGKYATNPDEDYTDLQAGESIYVQKFRRIYEDENGVLQHNNNERRTLVAKDGMDAKHIPIGEFAINSSTDNGSGSSAPNDHFVFVQKGDGSYIPWPLENGPDGTVYNQVPTGIWFTKSGTYHFATFESVDANYQPVGQASWSVTANIQEGNLQFVGDLPPNDNDPNNLNVAGVSENSIVLSITLPTNSSQYDQTIVYRSGVYFTTISSVSEEFTVSGLSPGTQYCFSVSLKNSSTQAESGLTDEVCQTTFPVGGGSTLDTPTNLHAAEIGENYIRIAWDTVDGAATYKVQKNDANYFFTGSDLFFIDNGVEPEETVNYKVWAYNSPNYSDSYAVIDVTSLAIGPFVASFTATPESGAAPMTVNFVSTSTGGPTDFYWEVLNSRFGSESTATYTFNDPGSYSVRLETYRYRDYRSNAYKTINVYSSAPSNLSATTNSIPQVVLDWDDEAGADHYEIWRNNAKIAEVTVSAYTDPNVGNGDSHDYKIKAVFAAHESLMTDVVSAQVPYRSPQYGQYSDFVPVSDLSGDGNWDLVALRVHPTSGLPQVLALNSTDLSIINEFSRYDNLHEPRELVNFGDLNGTGGTEILLSAYDQINKTTVYEIRDCLTGELFQPGDVAMLAIPGDTYTSNVTDTQVAVCVPTVSGATKYRFYRNGMYIGESSSNCYTDSTVSPGTFYLYAGQAVRDKVYSPLSTAIAVATLGSADWYCVPSEYSDYTFFIENGRTKIAALGLCPSDHSPRVYIIDKETNSVEAENVYFDSNYTPMEIATRELNGETIIDVTAENQSGVTEGPQSRYTDGSLVNY